MVTKMSMMIFWLVTPCRGIMFLRSAGIYLQVHMATQKIRGIFVTERRSGSFFRTQTGTFFSRRYNEHYPFQPIFLSLCVLEPTF
jgi:hypothetical protein